MNQSHRKLSLYAFCPAAAVIVAAMPCLADEPADLVKRLAEQRAKIGTLHQVTTETTQTKGTTTKVTVDLWEKRDGDVVKQHVTRETVKSGAGSAAQSSDPVRAVSVSDGKASWRQMKVGDGCLVVKSKATPTDEFRALRDKIKDGRARSKDGGKVAGHECVLIEVAGGKDSSRFKDSYWISEKFGLILKRSYASAGGEKKELTTTELTIGEPIDDGKFTYTPPAGATVLDTDAMKPPKSENG